MREDSRIGGQERTHPIHISIPHQPINAQYAPIPLSLAQTEADRLPRPPLLRLEPPTATRRLLSTGREERDGLLRLFRVLEGVVLAEEAVEGQDEEGGGEGAVGVPEDFRDGGRGGGMVVEADRDGSNSWTKAS
jgi:hypothetical protein